jgi:signal transduction histidine kinase/ActR/RegA family two-component response regulator
MLSGNAHPRATVTVAAMRVLLVEDDRDLCDLLQEFLIDLGHQPLVVHTAEAALELLRTEPLDVVLLDIRLPGMSGLDFLRLQAVRELRVPILVISGNVTESEARESLRLGAFDFIGKPLILQRLEELLASLSPSVAPERPAPAQLAVRRRAPRASVALPVKVHEDDGTEWEATSIDVSATGIKIRSRSTVCPGSAATLAIALPDGGRSLEVMSVLVRADLDGYAFYFLNLSDEQLERLRALVRGVAPGRPGQAEPPLRILQTIGQAISASLDVDEVLRIALDALTHVTGHEISSLHLLTPDGTTLHLRGDRGLRPFLREVNRVLPVGEGVIGRVAATGQPVHLVDASTSPDLLPAARAVVQHEGIQGFVCVPIRSRGRILGALSLGRRSLEPFREPEVALVEAAAHQIGLALENAQLYSETRRQLEDLRSAETQLVEHEKLSTVGKLAVGLAHEIRNRLTAILGQAELLLRAPDDPANSRERLQVIVKETARAARMLQNLVEFSRPHATERRACRLADQVRWVLELKSHELRRDRIQVVTELESVPPVRADEAQIQQALLNLVQNAHQAMATHVGERILTMRLAAIGGRARLEVLDTGPGIAPAVLPRIFDAFSTTKAPSEGSGLGLWVSYAIVERHEGSLRAENRPEGGAVFTIELPLGAP